MFYVRKAVIPGRERERYNAKIVLQASMLIYETIVFYLEQLTYY